MITSEKIEIKRRIYDRAREVAELLLHYPPRDKKIRDNPRIFPREARRRSASTTKGFSLIEVLIVIAIIVVLSAVVVANFGAAREQLALKRAAHQIVQDLRVAQEMAMSAAKESGGCSGAKGYGIYIDLDDNNKTYILYADMNNPPDERYSSISADCIVQTLSIAEKGVIIKEIQNTVFDNDPTTAKVSINFKPPNPNINIQWLKDDKNEVKIVLALETDQSKTKTVAINRAGMLEIKDNIVEGGQGAPKGGEGKGKK